MNDTNPDKIEFLKTLLEFDVVREQAPGEIKDLCVASRKLELPLLDYLTIRDLLETGGCRDDGPSRQFF